MTIAGGWIVILLTGTRRQLLQKPWTEIRTEQTKGTSGAATAKIGVRPSWAWVKFPLPFRSQTVGGVSRFGSHEITS